MVTSNLCNLAGLEIVSNIVCLRSKRKCASGGAGCADSERGGAPGGVGGADRGDFIAVRHRGDAHVAG